MALWSAQSTCTTMSEVTPVCVTNEVLTFTSRGSYQLLPVRGPFQKRKDGKGDGGGDTLTDALGEDEAVMDLLGVIDGVSEADRLSLRVGEIVEVAVTDGPISGPNSTVAEYVPTVMPTTLTVIATISSARAGIVRPKTRRGGEGDRGTVSVPLGRMTSTGGGAAGGMTRMGSVRTLSLPATAGAVARRGVASIATARTGQRRKLRKTCV